MSEQFLRKIYADILLGYSSGLLHNSRVFIRHFNAINQGEIDERYLELLKESSKDLVTEKEKLAELEKTGQWTPADDSWIFEWRDYVERLCKTRDHPLNAHMRAQTIQTIEDEQKKIDEKIQLKNNLLGATAESWASRRINEFYVYLSLYKDNNFTEPYLDREEFNELDDKALETIVLFYNSIIGELNNSNIKKVAISGSFQSSFGLIEDYIFSFFGRPISLLTFHQTELAIYGRYFKHLLSEKDVPSAARTDPDLLINWHNGDKNVVAPAETTQVLDKLSQEAAKTGGKIKGNLNMRKVMQGLLS